MIKNRRKGFSLTEVVIAAVIFILAITALFEAFNFLNRNTRVLIGYLNLYLKGREMIDHISRDCRIAIRVVDNYAGYTTTDNSLILKVPSLDASNDILDVNNEFDYIIYTIQDGDLWKRVMPGPNSSREARDSVLKQDMQNLYITSEGTPLSGIGQKSAITTLTLHLYISESVLEKEYTLSPGTTVKLMNYEWEFIR